MVNTAPVLDTAGGDLAALIAQLATAGVRLSLADGGRGVHVDAPRGVVTLDMKRAILAHKGALLAMLATPPDARAAAVRAGLAAGSRLGCAQGAAHHRAWRYAPDLGRYVCRTCDPVGYVAAFPMDAPAPGSTSDAAGNDAASPLAAGADRAAGSTSIADARAQLAAALLAHGAAHAFPRLPFAFSAGPSTGAAVPFKTLIAGAEAWAAFADGASHADLAAACRAAGVPGGDELVTPSPAPIPEPAPAPELPADVLADARTRADLRDWPEVFAALDTGALWIARVEGGADAGEGTHGEGGEGGGMVRRELDALSQPAGATARRLVTLMEREGITQLWLHRTWLDAAGLPARPFTQEETRDGVAHDFTAGSWATDASVPGTWGMQKAGRVRPWMKFYRRGQSGTVAMSLPALDGRASWRHAGDARTLLAAVLNFRAAMRGYAYRSGPGATSAGLVRVLHRGNRTALDLSASMAPADFPEPARTLALPAGARYDLTPQIGWLRALAAGEQSAPYVHGYDKNAMFLAACSSLRVGFGAAAHLTAPGEIAAAVDALTSPRKPIRRPVGYWLARVTYDTLPDAVARGLLPHPCYATPKRPAPGADEWRWYHTATLALAGETGARLDVREAYVWAELHEPLEPWYQRLRDARAALTTTAASAADGAPALALATVKTLYAQGIGWLDATWLRDSDAPEDLYRPDWRHAAVSTANANLWRNLAKVYAASGRAPFAVLTDAAYYVADDPDPLASAPDGLRLDPSALGQYKVKLSAFPAAHLAPVWELMAAGRDMGRVIGQFTRTLETAGAGAGIGKGE